MKTLIKPTLCIYHGNCSDGFGAALVVWMRYGESVTFHAGQYGQQPPDCTGHNVMLVDFSYKLPELQQIIEQANSVTILDHHKTAQADIQPLLDMGTIHGEFDMSRSGAAMTWDWCYPAVERPRLIDIIQDRDLWQFQLHGTEAISAALFSYRQDFVVWSELLSALETGEGWDEIYTLGCALLRKHSKDVTQLIEQTQRRMTIGGYDVPVANLPYMFASDAGNIMSEGEPFAASYYDTASKRKFSLRAQKNGVDVSEIARQYGGGGHAAAAGFEMPIGWEGEISASCPEIPDGSGSALGFTALCHSKSRQIGKPVGFLVENEAGGLAAVHNLGRVTWLDDCVAGPVEKAASAQDGGEPVAWLCVYPDGSAFGAVTEQRSVDVWIRRESDGRTVCPLYTHPPSAEVVKEHERKAHHRGQAEIIERMCQIINGLLDGKFVPRYGLLEPWKTTHERLTERLSSPTSAVVPEWMHGISEGIKTQNNRITADPLFVVFQKHEIVVDEDYDYDRISWGNSDGEADDEVQARLDEMRSDPDSDFFMDNEIELHDEDTGIEDFRRCALKEIEEFVTACFTEAGANDYLAVNGHNLRKPFVYVTSLYRNEEMKRLRGWLMQLPPEQEQE
ncbi:DHHA1 domain-containing protein (plasmid) [Marinobacter sp. M3C]|jgi:oligoribonuclease NrnB/cAMP/cGMP phosphodiesterase (DHH superfamily)|uniref:DHHA1 domain-containing protein n=1 Tax=Marinobacter sp. M3C TaxID=2917715 RepID=UPI00200C74E8|nr:DHHA1 domain-containing protein [Marinobacter sp. M3C]MCL1485171.1 DHHA1 domain-containing protein [Marinobacter sp.]UQG62804.1 DHHA1 domain-containing protein [Marinobacter sp. M3C]